MNEVRCSRGKGRVELDGNWAVRRLTSMALDPTSECEESWAE